MHASERSDLISSILREREFVSLQDLCTRLKASPATIRRDLERLEANGKLKRVHGGARAIEQSGRDHLLGVPFELNRQRNARAKAAIGRAAARLCRAGDAIIIDGGTTTFQMCPHLGGTDIQVLTNSLHIVNALLSNPKARIALPGGTIYREQNIILDPFEDGGFAHFQAATMFTGAAALGPRGVMQSDAILVQAERRFMACSDKLVVLVDSSKFRTSANLVLCALSDVDVVVTDAGATKSELAPIRAAGIEVVIAE
jgi:DeoR family ulaG and ulaABCDEF operon transcriptional repressor